MSDQKELFLFGQTLPGNDSVLIEKIQGCANFRNRHGANSTKALEGIPASNILQIAVGSNNVAFLFNDFRVARLSFDIKQNKIESGGTTSAGTGIPQESAVVDVSNDSPSHVPANSTLPANNQTSAGTGQSSYAAATAAAAANRSAKIRRVMMAARRPGGFCGRTGVIVDRARPLVPASSIPEELIAQAQVVLQGKSREVIVRELQRTNLNVNEAVNNLLSRDDDEGDELDETSEAYLHEELLSLLDAGLRTDGSGTAAIIDHENIYASPEGYEYMVTRDLVKRRDDVKYKERGKENAENSVTLHDYIAFDDTLQYWKDNEGAYFPPGVTKFLKIGAMHSELICLADDGKIYSWAWDKSTDRSNSPHPVNSQFFLKRLDGEEKERIIDLETCAWRTVVLTNLRRVGSFMDIGCGKKISNILFEPLIDISDGEAVERLHVSSMFSVVKTINDRLYWRGIYPYNERRKIFEKSRNKQRKHVTFDVNEIVEGAEVRTKSAPIYSAGCVGVNFSSGVPTVGTLMESAWTLDETCRFRIQTPEQYDQVTEDINSKQGEKKVSFNISVRKRAAPSDEGATSTTGNSIKEAAWSLKDVVFVKEEIFNDIAVVKVVDGTYCGVVYKSSLDKHKCDSANIPKEGLRLMRKDDLITTSGKACRAPDVFQQQLIPLQLPSNVRRIISMVVDNTGFRILVEKKNRVHLIRLSCIGKLFSDHVMPICLNTLCKSINSARKPTLENYGDDGILMLRDATGNIVPLLRNAAGGFREPPFIGMARVHSMAVGLRYLKSADEVYSAALSSCEQLSTAISKNSTSKSANRLMILTLLVAPSPDSDATDIPSLMQAILYCNLKSVCSIIDKLTKKSQFPEAAKFLRSEIVEARIDGNRNILHAAVMNAYSSTNKDQADVNNQLFNQKWQDEMQSVDSSVVQNVLDDSKADPAFAFGGPILNKERQLNSIEIIKVLVKNPVIQTYFIELMSERDTFEQTPFICAIQMRAYTAAAILWNAIEKIRSKTSDDTILSFVSGLRSNDSPLFVLCYNDTCSFTWTGEEHVNQDIFECKTCGLMGTLCCCTECAYTCHRNHDCRLKRTSPTAYCDCWEKCPCKALVSGNPIQREYLLTQILRKTKLIYELNSRGEHLLLFLARTVGRQLVEQENFVRHVSKMKPINAAQQAQNAADNNIPEHDLEPPKFARQAFDLVLKNWCAVKSLLEVGLKNTFDDSVIVEDIYHLSEQNGSTHLDKFVFTLLARCQETHLDALLNTLISQANLKDGDRDPQIDEYISRFIRSVIRLFTLIIVISPSTAGIVLAAISDATSNPSNSTISTSLSSNGSTNSSRPVLSNYRAVAISGMLSLVRASLPSSLSSSSGKESKKKSLNAFIAKARRVFQVLVTYSIAEIINAADALAAPVRMGMVKSAAFALSHDVLDVVERYLHSEKNLSTLLINNDNSLEITSKMHKKKSNNETITTTITSDNFYNAGDSDSDSESDNDEQPSRRLNSQSSGNEQQSSARRAHRSRHTSVDVSGTRRKPVTATTAIDTGDSTDSISSPSGDESDSEDDEEDDEPNAYGESHDIYNAPSNRIGNLNESEDNNEDDEEEEEREIEDEEEDAYFNMDEEEDVESAGDVEDVDPSNAGDSNDAAFIGHDDISVELTDSAQQPADTRDSSANNPSHTDYFPTISAIENENSTLARDNNSSDRRDVTSSSAAQHDSGISPAFDWAVHQIRNDNENRDNGIHQSAVERGENRVNTDVEGSTTAATVGSQATNSTNTSSRLRFRNPNLDTNTDDSNNTARQTGMQLSMAFSVLVKLMDELMLELVHYKSWYKNGQKGLISMLTLDPSITYILKECVEERLKPIWDWLYVIMDRTEAKLKFGNSLMSSSVGPLVAATFDADKTKSSADTGAKKDDKRHRKSAKAESKRTLVSEADASLNINRSELCSYFLSLLRSYSAENGDDLPIIEYNSLKSITFIVEAYLSHVNCIYSMDNEEPTEVVEQIQDPTKVKNIRRFYQRSKSICYPHISAAESHHAFKYSAGECLPLSTQPHLLQPEVERNVLFALPVPHRTRDAHVAIAKEHGVSYPTHHSFAEPPIKYSDITLKFADNDEKMDVNILGEEPSICQDRTNAESASFNKELFSFDLDGVINDKSCISRVMLQKCLGRWSNTALFLSKAFHEYIISNCGGDASLSILLSETAGYHIRQSQFRRRMEKFKAAQSKELVFSHISREKNALISSTIKQLNQNFSRRNASSTSSLNNADGTQNPVLASNKVKVTFQDEPGEGTGVARSFYSAVADAIMTMQHLPSDLNAVTEDGTTNNEDFGGAASEMWGSSSLRRPPPSTSPTRNFFSRLSKRAIRQVSEGETTAPDYRIRTRSQRSSTGVFQPIRSSSSTNVQSSSSIKRNNKSKSDETSKSADATTASVIKKNETETSPLERDLELLPLFYKPSKSGHYTPIPGSNSPARLNAFRNIGRIIGLCLQQMEIFPLPLCRHVLKHIIGRSITWFDLAFYDHELFNSLRLIAFNEIEKLPHSHDHYKDLYLSFSVAGKMEEGESGQQELKPGGEKISVSKENVLEYIYLFIQYRLLGNHVKCLDAMRRGVFDVIPAESLDQLTSEDLQLILCGNQEISVALLESYTTFSDESSAAADVLSKYKQWFWSTVSKFNNTEKQDLVFFWTGSPSLPSTEENFQPLPSIMIRPADDHHLPTANTCISRLYLPLYSSKKILRSKLLLAIKARNFGFV